MLNTMSLAHDKIFGTKFLSFERLEAIRLYTVCYAVFWRIVMKSDSQRSLFFLLKSHFYTPILPLLSYNKASFTL